MQSPVKVIGIGDNGAESLLPVYRQWIEESELLVGGERHLGFFPEYHGEKLTVKGGLSAIVSKIAESGKKTVVLASGDPLFYGIGSYLAKKLPVEIYPGISSIQQAFAKMQESWQDCEFLSVHGRSMKGLVQKIDGLDKVCLLTDEANNPAAIARYLLSFGVNEYRAFVAENLGGVEERTRWMTMEEMAEAECAPLNLVVLKREAPAPHWPLGIADEEFAQRKPDKGLITKREVRVLSLAALELKPNSIVWDIGTCTGSMAIEAARICRKGEVFAIEKNEADLENCRENMRKFRTDFTVVHGRAPAGLEEFADPDAVFIGGTGGEMKELLHVCCSRLKPGGRIVLNAATIETLYEAMQAFAAEGFETSVTLAQISRSKPILHMNRFEGLNPIYIVTAKRKEEK
ncbi:MULTISPECIES: bifunctional cobalt-precorrin-7 (C(5))-methyltransferase/cobalt-precorrin-6B (C(15))-methyltransferase [Aneurinibacillus]|uniref:Bifunctional cobalt-precorrin-7 (C(5))-methyltransferase/cobalt-precorrin-6B (C(15))-methyltransferase n=1 Tax=Aneurinibacillus thermoaerophilus TaxID=143495 RepID=A0A1G8BEL7_ANETH|nr:MULTISPECIES: bifunctional cobalt-precorrin-7 (C(5))-methyltransferase/cobalt-precorrin-6B (C(15))-methyltransferase [Aneurinibacillus]AMA71418.1 cobalamin biosynthesis protein CbiE [Aneurinibacillus sp. XH2]MED0678668.1 bifunctional cobalt-precorrin-7 (C(5))-methyltransferase/cobalt-precorrin-6B (C(15))-methyltransferase [Aneurinibacillus thermoaerophilus]MED0736642.1 bifunctional cobalt-precorrin-7 (C(5))-methyltransferase/cobalt-precorrin-6B (C(15))-methyltransferase [Aneurinibacillus ther